MICNRRAGSLVAAVALTCAAAACVPRERVEPPRSTQLGHARLSGQITDLDGAPVAGLMVTVSDDYCVPGRTSTLTLAQCSWPMAITMRSIERMRCWRTSGCWERMVPSSRAVPAMTLWAVPA